MFRMIMLILGLGISSSAAAEVRCLSLFSFTTIAEEFDYVLVLNTQHAVALSSDAPKDLIAGHADLFAKKIDPVDPNLPRSSITPRSQTRQIANLDYTIKGDFLTIISARIPSEFTGDGIYRQLLEKVLSENPGVNIIMTSLTGDYYDQYVRDFGLFENLEIADPNKSSSEQAVGVNPVFVELSKLGFGKIRSINVIPESRYGAFVRLSVYR